MSVRNVHPQVTLAIRVNGLEGDAGDYRLFALDAIGDTYCEITEGWSLEGVEGELAPVDICEIRLLVHDGGIIDLSPDDREITVSVLLVR